MVIKVSKNYKPRCSFINYNQIKHNLESVYSNASTYIPRVYKDYAKSTLIDGQFDDFPLYLINLVTSSPTAMRCYNAYLKSLRGSGFSNSIIENIKTANNESFWQFHKNVCSDLALLRRIAIRVFLTYDLETHKFKISSFEHVPAKWIRQKLDADLNLIPKFLFSPFLGTEEFFAYQDKSFELHEYFEDSEKIQEILNEQITKKEKHNGFLIWYCEKNLRNGAYSFPDFMAAEDAMKADAEINVFNYHNIVNSFTTPAILTIQGDGDELVANPFNIDEKITKRELYERFLNEEASGAENAGKMLIFWYRNNEEKPSIIPFPTNTENSKQYIETRLDNTLQIVRAWGVPNILANIETSGKLGNTKEFEDASKILNEQTEDNRKILESIYNMIFRNLHGFMYKEKIKILPYAPVFELPDFVFNTLTYEEKRKYILEKYGI